MTNGLVAQPFSTPIRNILPNVGFVHASPELGARSPPAAGRRRVGDVFDREDLGRELCCNVGALYAAGQVATGAASVVVAGGAESMSNVEHYALGLRTGVRQGDIALLDRLGHV